MNAAQRKKNVLPRLKVWLLQGKSITHNQAQQMFGTNRLAEYVRRLRGQGLKIEMTMTTYEGDIFGVYKLIKRDKINRIKSRAY